MVHGTVQRPSFLAGLLKGLGAYQETLAANDGAGFTAAYGKIRTIGKLFVDSIYMRDCSHINNLDMLKERRLVVLTTA